MPESLIRVGCIDWGGWNSCLWENLIDASDELESVKSLVWSSLDISVIGLITNIDSVLLDLSQSLNGPGSGKELIHVKLVVMVVVKFWVDSLLEDESMELVSFLFVWHLSQASLDLVDAQEIRSMLLVVALLPNLSCLILELLKLVINLLNFSLIMS